MSSGSASIPCSASADVYPSSRALEHIISSGPVMMPMSVCPSASRCRVAITPPVQLSACTDSVSGSGLPNGSNKTKGIPLECSLFRSIRVRLEKTRMAPSVCRRSMLSIQDESGCWRLPPSVVMTFKSCNLASRMVPRSTSRAQTLSKSWNTISIIRWLFVLVALREYPYRFNTALMVCRVSSETSALPLSALDTVERE